MMYVYILLIKQAFYQKSSDIKDKIKKTTENDPQNYFCSDCDISKPKAHILT